MSLNIKNLSVKIGETGIISKINLEINSGETHVIMGPNGSGKSTLAYSLLGHPRYHISNGKILLDKADITEKPTNERAKLGLFLSAQTSPELNGITVAHFLRVAKESLTGVKENPFSFYESLRLKMKKLKIDESFATRYLNNGFSGGEKKRAEILQLLTLNPKYAILDETDAGLDVDALKVVGRGLSEFLNKNKALLIITHESRLLKYLKPDYIHILIKGKIVKSGSKKLVHEIEKNGFNKYLPKEKSK